MRLIEVDDELYLLLLEEAKKHNNDVSLTIRCLIPKASPKKKFMHHVRYKEIHGMDEVIEMDISEHIKLHQRLSLNGNKIPLKILGRAASRRQYKDDLDFIDLSEAIAPYVHLFERIRINNKTGNINYQSYFHADHKKLLYIDIFDGVRSLTGISHEVLPEYKQGDRPLI